LTKTRLEKSKPPKTNGRKKSWMGRWVRKRNARMFLPASPENQSSVSIRRLMFPIWITMNSLAIRDNFLSRAACSPQCTAGVSGRCASTRVSAAPGRATCVTAIFGNRGRRDSVSLLICPRRRDMTATILFPWVKSAKSAWRLIASAICACSSMKFRSIKLPPP